MGYVPLSGLVGPCHPCRSIAQEPADRLSQLLRPLRVSGKSSLWRVHYLAASVQRAHEAGSSQPHGFEVYQPETLASARESEAVTVRQQLLLFRFGDPSPKADLISKSSFHNQLLQRPAQVTVPGNPQLSLRYPLQHPGPGLNHFPVPFIIFAPEQSTKHQSDQW